MKTIVSDAGNSFIPKPRISASDAPLAAGSLEGVMRPAPDGSVAPSPLA